MKIILNIYPDDDGIHCGGCIHKKESEDVFGSRCKLFLSAWRGGQAERLTECLKAEAEAREKT